MGEGTFGQVLECWDREKREMVAIKIVRGVKKYREAAMIEIEVLQQLGKHDKSGNRWVIERFFTYSIACIWPVKRRFLKFVAMVEWVYSLQLCAITELVWLS